MSGWSKVVMANNLPFISAAQGDPFDALGSVLAFDSRDWGQTRTDAWLWGIILGWGCEALAELADRHGWNEGQVRRLRILHLNFRRAQVHQIADPKGTNQ